MMQSAFGVEHGEVSKAEKKPTAGRSFTSYVAPGVHGAVAGKKGHKLRAAGTELGSQIAGGGAGLIAGSVVARKMPQTARGVHAAGGITGSLLGTGHAQKAGHYKKQKKGAL